MKRRYFLIAGGSAAISVCGLSPQKTVEVSAQTPGHTGIQSNSGAVVHPYASDMMTGFPPPAEKQVTRDNYLQTQAKLRWYQQHHAEFAPTQLVSRGTNKESALPRADKDIGGLSFTSLAGKQTTLNEHLRLQDADAFLVLKNGRIVYEHYFSGMTPTTPHSLWSLFKSLQATVIATLLDAGSLEESQCIDKYVPELATSGYKGATIRQILDMQSGIEYPMSEFARHGKACGSASIAPGEPIGGLDYLLTLKKSREHGSSFVYKNSDPAVLVWAAERVTGIRFADLLSERVWSRLGMERDAFMSCDQLGHSTGGLSLTARDLARWGQMCLCDGIFADQQIVPKSFFVDIRRNSDVDKFAKAEKVCPPASGAGYRSFFYHDRQQGDAIAAAGAFGQICYVNPKYHTVIVCFSSWPPNMPSGLEDLDEKKVGQFFRLVREQWHACCEISKSV